MNNRNYQEEAQIELILAASIGNIDNAIRALNAGAYVDAPLPDADIEIRAPYQLTDADRHASALHIAVTYGHADIVKLLLNNRAGPNRVCNSETPLTIAAKTGNIDIANILLDHGAHVNLINSLDESPFLISEMNSNTELSIMLLSRGADPNAQESYCITQIKKLHTYTNTQDDVSINKICDFIDEYSSSRLLFETLVDKNYFQTCILNAKTGPTCLALLRLIDFLKENGKHDIRKLLPAKYTFANKNLKEDIFAAIKKLPLAERLKKYDEILHDKENFYYHIFHMKRGYIWGVNEKRGILHDVQEAYNNDMTLNKRLLTALVTNDIPAMCACIEEGADTEITENKYNATALIFAINASNLHIVQSLLNHHAKIDSFGNSRMNFISPLHFAIYGGRQDILELLVDHMIKHYDIDRIVKFLQTHDNMKRCFKLAGTNSALLAPLQKLLSHLAAHNVRSDALLPESTQSSDKRPEAAPEITPAVSYPKINQEDVQHSEAMQQYLDKGRQLRTEATPPAYVVENPLTGAPLTQAPAAAVSDPFAAIDTILSAPVVPKQPSWIEDLNEIDFAQTEPSSTAVIMNQLGDLMSFEKPAKPDVNTFDGLVELDKQPAAAKPGDINQFDEKTEDQHDAHVAAQLDALPQAPKHGTLFAANNQKQNGQSVLQKKQVLIPNN